MLIKDFTETVSLHHHPEEQITYVLSGKLRFYEGDESYVVTAGAVLKFAANVPHGCVVLEQGSEVLDTFSPIRKDFL
ncbi:cupin domain-containing protein [Lapidilactobacillus bayanensis]|uniref:cupin domain-containing protein n=1 Tax=Lapidilactobacillus bayanensis TaxID=2485998 RepID=UPI000F79419A|nr:cupin domain-containing protein [Lapidilactobacillus bayanensis]